MDDVPVPPREKTEEELRAEAEAEEAAKQLTLDDYKAQLAAKRQQPQFNTRKAGEGSNEKEFGKLVPLAKDTIEDTPEEEVIVVVSFSCELTRLLLKMFVLGEQNILYCQSPSLQLFRLTAFFSVVNLE